MLKHIVMFKLKEFVDEQERRMVTEKIKRKLDELTNQIKEIKYLEVGINIIKSSKSYDLVLITEFEHLLDLDKYRIHPEHQKFIDFINQYKEKSVSVDFDTKSSFNL